MNQTRPNPQARRFLQWTLVVAFVAIPVVEIWMLVSVGGALGLLANKVKDRLESKGTLLLEKK